VTPVIKDADQLGFAGIERAIGDFGRRARQRRSKWMGIGSTTITNGMAAAR
jgi:2-oxoglutarate dehydrogenase E2 component (dihydrolipoamide succinyltransferase)